MKTAYILRGIPGSGKSTFARSLPEATICGADDYFTHEGMYVFDPGQLGEAHEQCQRKFMEAILRGDETVVADNTNIKIAHLEPYINMVHRFGPRAPDDYQIKIIKFDVSVLRAIAANSHRVPAGAIHRMANTFEALPERLRQYAAHALPTDRWQPLHCPK